MNWLICTKLEQLRIISSNFQSCWHVLIQCEWISREGTSFSHRGGKRARTGRDQPSFLVSAVVLATRTKAYYSRLWQSTLWTPKSPTQNSNTQSNQDFSLRCPLTRGHGNFGSIDADPPAAMRYTECRLEALTEAMLLTDLEQDTVDFFQILTILKRNPHSAWIPNLLLNGSSAIAVGMATNIPPHNLRELVDALSALIHNPEATLQELLEYLPGPDFPTGGLIMGNSGILEAYRTGHGRIVVRGKTDIELLDAKIKRTAIIIKEIPYQTNKASLIEKITELVESKAGLYEM